MKTFEEIAFNNVNILERIEHIEEKMSASSKRDAKRYRKKPKVKRTKKIKKRCQDRYKDKIKDSKNKNISWVCNSKGKLIKGWNKLKKRKLKLMRKRLKNKTINY